MNKSIAQIKLELHKATGGALPIGPPADVAAKLAALKEQMRQQGTNFDRRMQGVVNAEKTAGTGVVLPTDKASGGVAHMAGGGQYRSVLEDYNQPRILPTPEQEAIEPVYPEEYLIGGGGGKLTASALRSGAEQAAARGRIANVKIGSKAKDYDANKALLEKYKNTDWSKTPRGVNPFEPSPEYADYLRRQAEQVARDKILGKVNDTILNSGERASTNAFGQTGWDVGVGSNEYTPMADDYRRGGVVHMAGGGDVDQGDPLSNLPPISPQQTTAMDKYRLALWAEKNNPDMLTANNNELAALLMRNRNGQTYDDRSEEGATWRKSQANPSVSPSDLQNMPGEDTFGQRREIPRPESFDYPRLEKGNDYRRPEQEARQKRDEIARKAMELGFPFTGTYYAHGGRVTHAHHLDIEERPL